MKIKYLKNVYGMLKTHARSFVIHDSANWVNTLSNSTHAWGVAEKTEAREEHDDECCDDPYECWVSRVGRKSTVAA